MVKSLREWDERLVRTMCGMEGLRERDLRIAGSERICLGIGERVVQAVSPE